MRYTPSIERLLVCAVLASVVLAVGAGTAIAAISVVGEFDATLGGYGDDAGDRRPNEITVEGEFTVEGEPAQGVEVVVQSAEWTVLDTDSVSVFVEGDTSVEFDQHVAPGEVRLTTDEIPADTSVQLSFGTYYTGGTDADEVDAGTVTIEYESLGGSPGEKTFTANASMDGSPENRIAALENSGDGDDGNSLLLPGAVGGAILLLGVGFLAYRRSKQTSW